MGSIVIALTVSRDVGHGITLPRVIYLNMVSLISEESEATAMELHNWSKSEFEYGRRVLDSALEGARGGREAFLKGKSLTPFLCEGVRSALKPAAVGACIGLLGSYPGDRRSSIGRALAFGLVGWAIGLGAGVAWKTRGLTECVASNAFRKHWQAA